jgi:hypothetical protein
MHRRPWSRQEEFLEDVKAGGYHGRVDQSLVQLTPIASPNLLDADLGILQIAQRFSEKWIRAAWSEMNRHDWLVSRNVRRVGDGVRSGERGRNAQSRLAVSGLEVQPLSMSDVENDRHRATLLRSAPVVGPAAAPVSDEFDVIG